MVLTKTWLKWFTQFSVSSRGYSLKGQSTRRFTEELLLHFSLRTPLANNEHINSINIVHAEERGRKF